MVLYNKIVYTCDENLCVEVNNLEHLRVTASDSLDDRFFLKVLDVFNRYHAVILSYESRELTKDDLYTISELFGSIVKQKKGDVWQDLFVVTPVKEGKTFARGNKTQSMHTDDGYRGVFPQIIALHCEVQAENGGYSKLVNGSDIYDYLKSDYPDLIKVGFESDSIEYCTHSGNYITHNFFRYDSGNIGIAWSPFADEVKGDEKAIQLYRAIQSFAHKPENQTTFKLKPGEILVADNTAVLHGRTEFIFEQKRRLNRLWFDGVSSYPILLGFSS